MKASKEVHTFQAICIYMMYKYASVCHPEYMRVCVCVLAHRCVL